MSRIIRSYIVDIVETDDVIYCDNDGHLTYNIEVDKNELVRCPECAYKDECEQIVIFDIGKNEVQGRRTHYCSYGKRRE